MEDEKYRRREFEAGREMLEKYKLKRSSIKSNRNVEQISDEESIRTEAENQSMDIRSMSNNEGNISRDITYSSVSMSEGEGDGDLEGLAGRVNELEELLQGKEAVVEALHAEIDHLRNDTSSPTSSHSQNSMISYKDIIVTYHAKCQEFEQAVNQRDNLIEDLTTSLQQALASRDILLAQINELNSTQLGNANGENNFDEKITTLENALSKQKELVSELTSQLNHAQQNVKKLEQEKDTQNMELSTYKDQIENLNKKIQSDSIENDATISETNHLQKQYEDQVEKIKKDMKVIVDKFTEETNANKIKYENEMKKLIAQHQEELQQLKNENQNLETRYRNEIASFQSQLTHCNRTIDSIKSDLVTSKESHIHEKELLNEQIKLHKLQIDEITSKYISTASLLDSKESIERSLEQALTDAAALKTENESLKFKLGDLSLRYTAAQSVIENGQEQERKLSTKIFTLEKSLSRLSGISFEELDETAYHTIDDIALQYEVVKQKIDEKAEMEKKLVQKIEDLENLVAKTQKELELANLTKESYEKQIKDMKNTCDRLKSEVNFGLDHQQQRKYSFDSLDGMRMVSCEFEQEILELKKAVKKRDLETAEYIKKLEELSEVNQKLVYESEKLKSGLSAAYSQCAMFEEKLDQTLGFGESKLNCSNTLLDQTMSSNASSFDLEELLHKQSNYNKVLLKLDSCRQQLDDLENEKIQLQKKYHEKIEENDELKVKLQQREDQHQEEINILKIETAAEAQKSQQLLLNIEKGNDELKQMRIEIEEKHAKEMEELRTYFEQKCLQMEKQYSEEIFSQQSKKMSDNDSELEELTEDLYVDGTSADCIGGGGDAIGILDKENKHDLLMTNRNEQQRSVSEEIVRKISAEYEEKIETLRKQLQEVKEKSGRTLLLRAVNQFCQTEQNIVSAVQDSSELNELRADYNRQLEEQVRLARIDIINAVREQIEALITTEAESDENWPTELLELRNKFTSNSKREIQALKERHVLEIQRIKDESSHIIIDLREEINRIKSISHESLQSNLMKERDRLHKTCITLKGLVSQLVDYFAVCEEELNTTLINEVFKKQFLPRLEKSSICSAESNVKIKRVHFAPQSNEIATIVASDSDLEDLINSEKDVMTILKSDLDICLKRLKADSAKILNESFSDNESSSTGMGSDHSNEKVVEMEKLLSDFQQENAALKAQIMDLQNRLLIVESKKEVFSEGYGEQEETVGEETNMDFSMLQDRAKNVIMNGSCDTGYLLQLIDELCRHIDKSKEDVKKEKEDLQHQIEAADKQLRLTRKFQEEQAVEREAERDEATKQIEHLQERLRDREREKDRDYRNSSAEQSSLSSASASTGSPTLRQSDESELDASVETLTAQVRETETRRAEAESELKAAVAKIWELREVIHDLEQQLQARSEREDVLNGQIEQLEEVIVAQTKNQQELVQELDVVKAGHENDQLSDHIGHLQEELRKHQLSSEQLAANSSALRQLRLEIRELKSQLDKKTREVESMHVCGSSLSLSHPSEDISIREQIEAARCPTPDDPSSPPILPLDNVLKLKETLFKHFRVEDVALKRLKDFDIQLGNLQRQNEELLAEQEILQQTTSEQLFQIETLRARLEQQKQNAPFAQRQATSRLETQLYEMNEKLELAERAIGEKDMELAEVKNQLERVSRILAEKESEIANVVRSETEALQNLRGKIEVIEEENRLMKTKLNIQEKSQNDIPQLIDSIIAEKNEEIEELREQLIKRERQLEVYMRLDEVQLRELIRQNEQQKNSARTLSDILSINSECEDLSDAIREAPNFSKMQNLSHFKVPHGAIQSTLVHSKRDGDHSHVITETPKVPRLELGSHSPDEHDSETIHIPKDMESIQLQSHEKIPLVAISPSQDSESEETHEESTASDDQNGFLCPRHGKISNINPSANISPTNNFYLMQQNNAMTIGHIQELEKNFVEIREELAAKTAALEQRDLELQEIQSNLEQLHENIKSLNQDRLFYKTEYEKAHDNESKIQKDLEEVENALKLKTEELINYKERIQANEKILSEESKRYKHSEASLAEKQEELSNLKEIIAEKDMTIKSMQNRNVELENENKELYEYRHKFDGFQQELIEYRNEIHRLTEGLNNRDLMIRKLEEIARRSSSSGGSSPSEKDQEIYHLQEYLKEKDKVIRQMSDDSKSLHRALETIQNKMKESGNVVELRRKLKDQRKNNVELSEENAKLKTEVEMLSMSKRAEEDNDITDRVQQELNLSAKLDQQLLNVIDSEPEEVLNKCEDLRQANKEIEELNRIKDDLEIEREMLKSQISEYENRIIQLKDDSEEMSSKLVRMDEELTKEKHLVRSMQLKLQREKNMAQEDKNRDTELISLLRIKLDEALEIRDRLIMEKKNREVMNSVNGQNIGNLPEIQAALKEQLLELTEELETEKRKTTETEEAIQNLKIENEHIQKQQETAGLEIEKLTSSLESANCAKDELKSDLRRVKDELKTKTKECNWQKSILKTMSDAENKRKQQKTTEQNELKTLRREIKNAQEVMLDFEGDLKTLKEQLAHAAEREAQLTRCIESLTDKETEFTEQLSAYKIEEKKLRGIIAEQQNELKLSLRREIELADDLRREKSAIEKNMSPSKSLYKRRDTNTSIERLTQEKVHLHEKVAHLREENERYLDQIRFLETQLSQKSKSSTENRNDAEERLQHFYGIYLRSESRRKALVYQKHYLVCIIAGYQRVEENTLAFLAQLTQTQREYACKGKYRRNALVRFRSVVLLVVSIQRIKWLILRWRTGRRFGANVVLGSNERLVPSTRQRTTSGHSPPVKERPTNGSTGFSHNPYLRRLTDIQQSLHLKVPEPSFDNFKSD